MRAEDVKELSVKEIEARVRELEEERFRLRFRGATEPLDNPIRLRAIRKDIARLKTVLRQRQSDAATTTKKTAAAR